MKARVSKYQNQYNLENNSVVQIEDIKKLLLALYNQIPFQHRIKLLNDYNQILKLESGIISDSEFDRLSDVSVKKFDYTHTFPEYNLHFTFTFDIDVLLPLCKKEVNICSINTKQFTAGDLVIYDADAVPYSNKIDEPVMVVPYAGFYIVIDGNHRLAARLHNNMETTLAYMLTPEQAASGIIVSVERKTYIILHRLHNILSNLQQ